MALLARIKTWVLAKIRTAFVQHTAAAVGATIGAAILAGWGWIWIHFNPMFVYRAQPSALSSHFVALAQILNDIEKDSRLFCSGGWDEQLAWIGLRKCHRFTFAPTSAYKMMICTHDERTAEVYTSDQLVALQYFAERYSPLECFNIARLPNPNAYSIAPAKDSRARVLQFPGGAQQETNFCGCSADEETAIATAIGAKLN